MRFFLSSTNMIKNYLNNTHLNINNIINALIHLCKGRKKEELTGKLILC